MNLTPIGREVETDSGGYIDLLCMDAAGDLVVVDLSDVHGVNINAATFQYFREPDGSELVSRVFLIEPSRASSRAAPRGPRSGAPT